MKMFYVIERNYVGPNHQDHIDGNSVEITTAPARGNSRVNDEYPVITDGWCGTTNDWAVYAHGQYETIEAAREGIIEHVESVESMDDLRESTDDDDTEDSTVEAYMIGKFEPWCRETTYNWSYEGMIQDITAETTDDEITELAGDYEAEANNQGGTLCDIEEIMIDYRNDQRAEVEQS